MFNLPIIVGICGWLVIILAAVLIVTIIYFKKKEVMSLLKWFDESNRGRHVFWGTCLYLLLMFIVVVVISQIKVAAGMSLAAMVGAAFAMEFKDKSYGNKWDWIDIACTVAIPLLITIIIWI